MTPARRQSLRQIMLQAWSIYRARAVPGCNVRTFGDALRNAWAWITRKPPVVAPVRNLHLRPMVQSPIARTLAGQAYAGRRAWDAGRLTSRLGA